MNQHVITDLNSDNGSGSQDPTLCKKCRLVIETGAVKCPHCNSEQKIGFWVLIKYGVPAIAVLATLYQVYLATRQLNLAEKDRIDASKVLEEAKQTKAKADEILTEVENREKEISKRLAGISYRTNSIETRLGNIESDFTKKQQELSEKIVAVSKEAETKIKHSTKKVDDQIQKSNDRLLRAEKDFKQKSEGLTAELHTLRDETSAELEKLKWRDQLMQLADSAISDGKRSDLEELEKIYIKDFGTDRAKIVLSYIVQIKKFYLNINRFKTKYLKRGGAQIEAKSLSTSEAIQVLANNESKEVRYLVAEELGKRKEIGVPEALLNSVEKDNCLDVVARSVSSFESITGYDSPDVLDYRPLKNYWEKNKEEINKKLKKPDANPGV